MNISRVPVLNIINLKKHFGKKKVINNLNLTIYDGDTIALLGPNGAGKSTLMELICNLKKITGGKIDYCQVNKKFFFKSLGMQFQTGTYPIGIRVKDLVGLYSNVYGTKIDLKLMKDMKINEIMNSDVNDLSFGQRQRMELFLILASEVKFLILDEITAGMDIAIKSNILKILKEHIKKNKLNVIYISHNLEEIKNFCNRVVILTTEGIVYNKPFDPEVNLEKIFEKILEKNYQVKSQ